MRYQHKKRFGQHFLHDKTVLERLQDYIHPQPSDHVVEIGPGQGALTHYLLARVARLDLIEIDHDLVAQLQAEYCDHEPVLIHQADALTFDYASLPGQHWRIVGNLPYNISSPLLFHLAEWASHIDDMHLMLQEEFVDRLVAHPGSRHYGRLSVMIQLSFTAKKILSVAPSCFDPPPKVMSAIVRLVPCVRPKIHDEVLFSQIVQQAFSWRRKMFKQTLKRWVDERHYSQFEPWLTCRPEQISVQDFVTIANLVYNIQS